MNVPGLVLASFGGPARWSWGGIPVRLLEHMAYSTLAILLALVIAVPIGAMVGHTGRGGFLLVGLANGLRALPSLGLLILLVIVMRIGLLPVILTLTAVAIPPLLAGAYAGVHNVDRAVVDAARGMGMREPQVLLRVEMPNALPLVLSGLRSAFLQVIATVVVAAYVSFGGLGRYLIDGLRQQDYPQMAEGALLVAALALTVEGLLALVQRAVVSPGLRGGARRVPVADLPRTETDTPAPQSPAPELAGVER
ncbi:MAG: ABC transporter permease [Pseudonocardia sp.]